MGAEPDWNGLLREMKALGGAMDRGETKTSRRLDTLEASVNDICKRLGRPGGGDCGGGTDIERKSAIEMCLDRRSWSVNKIEGGRWQDYTPSSEEIEEAITAHKAFKALLHCHGDFTRLDHEFQKSLSAFNFGSSGWAVPPTFSSRVLSCLTDPTDFLSLLPQETISGGSIIYPLDNSEIDGVGWACDGACEGPVASVAPPGQIELKPEPLRCRICATSDLLEDASFSVETWLSGKVSRAFRAVLAAAFICGDGLGKPMGILSPKSGIPVCETAPGTPDGEFRWQDLVALKFQLDEQYQARGVYLMNSATLGLVMTMTDATGRPIWSQTPQEGAPIQINGSPVRIVSQMPDASPGSTPVLFADLGSLYQVVHRRGLTFSSQPAGWCSVFLFSQRIGGAVVCPGAGRLLRIS